jgi:hypothetical protein
VASAPESRRRRGRPRLLRTVVRRLVGRLLSDRRPAAGPPPVAAGVVDAAPVRAPWSLLRYLWRARHPSAPGTEPAAPAPERRRPIGAAPTMLRAGRPMLAHRALRGGAGAGTRRGGPPGGPLSGPLTGPLAGPLAGPLTGPLTGPPAAGPDVRPGHELVMRPSFGVRAGGDHTTTPGGPGADGPGSSADRRVRDVWHGHAVTRAGTDDRATGRDDRTTGGRQDRTTGRPGRLPGDDGRGFGPGTGFAGGLRGPVRRDGVATSEAFGADLAGGLPMAGGWRAPAADPTAAGGRHAGSGHPGPGHTGPGHPAPSPGGSGREGSGHVTSSAGTGAAGHATRSSGAATGHDARATHLGPLRRAIARAGGLADRLTRAAREHPAHRHDTLAAAPPDGPSVHSPEPVGYLRVLGSAALPPGQVPDPAGAVQLSPAAGHRAGPAARGAGGGQFPVPVPSMSPRQRWEAAVAARPLESPRPLPSALHAMATAITGRARPPQYTTGPATRHALAAAGALGATTGTVVHLPAAPVPGPAVSAVLAHELTHTRNPVRRPRFFLGGASGLLDDDERSALAAGRQQLAGLAGQGRDAAAGLADQGREAAAGIVGQLPVGGGLGAIGDVATRAARAAVLEAVAGPMAAAQGFAGNAMSAASGAMDTVSGAVGTASDALDSAAGAASGAVDAVSGAASGVAAQAAGAAGQVASAAKAALDPDKVVEIVEQRLLREIERRGGRWAGVF